MGDKLELPDPILRLYRDSTVSIYTKDIDADGKEYYSEVTGYKTKAEGIAFLRTHMLSAREYNMFLWETGTWYRSREEARKRTHRHREAFCHMIYQCLKCGTQRVIWNSRDGVTPFMLQCQADSDCDGSMQHREWQRDLYDPDYRLKEGNLYWRDMSDDEKLEFATEAVNNNWEHREFQMRRMFKAKEQAIKHFMSQYKPGSPMLATHKKKKEA